jgi:flagellar hook-associated protein 2
MASVTSDLRFSGLGSGIDSSKIIDGLTSINQQRISQLQSRKVTFQQQQATFSSLQSQLLSLQGKLGTLSRSVGGAFEGRKATISDETLATAAASSSAQTGTFSLRVEALAQAQQLASQQGFTDVTAGIKEGTLAIKVGTGTTTTVTINSTNNTLEGLVNTINNSGADVKASIVKDGTATPFRLLLTSTKTGAANTITLTNNLTTGSGSSIDINQTVQAASDSQVRLGTGAGAIVANSATNQVSDLIAGVTLNLQQADPTKTITLSVTNDTAAAKTAVEDFVESFNDVIDFIDDRDNFDTATQQAGILLGNRDIQDLRNELERVVSGTVPNVNSKANNINSVGITFNAEGKLEVNTARLDDALNGKIEGVSASDVKRLFAVTGSSTNPGVSFLLAGNATEATAANAPVEVNVTQAARRAAITGTSALAGSITITSSNNNFVIRLNGITSTVISLPPGSYTGATLAAAIQSAINADPNLLANDVQVNLDVNRLRISSQIFGAASNVSFTSGTAIGASSPLGFLGSETSTGLDVAGTFKVNGVTEATTGIGQILSGNSGNAKTDGLQVRVTLEDGAIAGNPDANVTVSKGIASRLNEVLNRFVDPASGRFKTIDDTFTRNIENIDNSVTKQNELLEQKKEQLVSQFAAMESAVSRLKNMGDQLSSQLGSRRS